MGQNVSASRKSDFSAKNLRNATIKNVVSVGGWGTPMPTYVPNFGPSWLIRLPAKRWQPITIATLLIAPPANFLFCGRIGPNFFLKDSPIRELSRITRISPIGPVIGEIRIDKCRRLPFFAIFRTFSIFQSSYSFTEAFWRLRSCENGISHTWKDFLKEWQKSPKPPSFEIKPLLEIRRGSIFEHFYKKCQKSPRKRNICSGTTRSYESTFETLSNAPFRGFLACEFEELWKLKD